MPKPPRWRRAIRSSIAALALHASVGAAQAHYYNLDGGRPVRVEDAQPTGRYSVDVDFAPFQFERFSGGINRYRFDPKLSYGILPFTELELRFPFVRIQPPASSAAATVNGPAGLSVGALREINLETPGIPAFAIAGEILFPVGALAAAQASYVMKILMTTTTRAGRFHFNAGGGTYSIQGPPDSSQFGCAGITFGPPDAARAGDGCGIPIIVDLPCNVRPASGGTLGRGPSSLCMTPRETRPSAAAPVASPPTVGARWFAGVGFDHAVPLSSMLFTADVYAERLERLYAKVDWVGEIGLRRQITPTLVVHTGAGWHFAGTIRSASVSAGASYEIATPPLFGR